MKSPPAKFARPGALQAGGGIVVAVAALVVVGWMTNHQGLVRWFPGAPGMVMNAAVCALLCGGGLLALARGWQWTATGCGLASALLSAWVLAQFFLGRSLGIDQFFWQHQWSKPLAPPGRMTPNATVAFILAGIGLAMLARRQRGRWLLPVMSGTIAAFALVPLLGYLIAHFTGASANTYQGMAVPAQFCLLMLAITLLQGARAEVADESSARLFMGAALGMFIAIAVGTAQSNAEVIAANRWVVHSYTVRGDIADFVEEIARMESSLRAYALTGENSFLEHTAAHRRQVHESLEILRDMAGDDPIALDRVGQLRQLTEEKFAQGDALIRARQEGGAASAAQNLLASQIQAGHATHTLMALADTLREEENRLLALREQERSAVEQNAYRVEVLGGLLALGLLSAAAVATRRAADGRRRAAMEIGDLLAREKTAHVESKRTQSYFRALFESAPGLYLVLQPDDFKIVGVSEAYLRGTNTTREQLIGKLLFEMFPDDPHDPIADGVRNLRVSLERVKKQKEVDVMAVQRYPIQRPAAQGGGFELRFWSPVNSPVVDPEGGLAYIIHRVEDVTEFIRLKEMQGEGEAAMTTPALGTRLMETDIVLRSQELQRLNEKLRVSEERFRSAFDDAGIGMALVGLDGRWLRVNTAICEIVGYPEAVLLKKTFQEITHPDDLNADLAYVHDLLEGRRRVYQMEKRYFHSDGHVVWIRLTASLVREESGAPLHFVSQIEDITVRKKLEVNLSEARDQALESSRLKSEFLATMSHEIRTPMNAVIGMAGLLADTPLNSGQEEMVTTILGGAENLLSIINDILDFSRIEAGRMRLDPVDFDFRRVVEETVALLAPRAHEKNVELTCEFQSIPTGLLLGDGGRVRQVLTNLIGNAIKFTDVGEVDVTVRTVAETGSRSRLRVEVRDTGVGIQREAQARLFQPFTQADGSTTRRFGGTGLGLAISRQLIELMGGEIGLESEEERGSLFWFELEFTRRGGGETVPNVTALPAGRRVLVVDDNETNRRILIGQLEPHGVQIESFAGGASALMRLRDPATHPWHLILLDWHMPGMNGLELASAIRADPALAGIPLVMLSSAGPTAESGMATSEEFAAFLTKPVTAQQLSRCLHRVLAKSSPPVEHPPTPLAVSQASGNGLRILLAEDNPANQRVAVILLAKLGYTVEVAADGQQALTLLGTQEFDAVLMDCQMPVLDGYQTTRRIRAGTLKGVNARVPIIALTAYARPEDRARCEEAGMDEYVTKPIRPVELLAALARCGFRPGTATGSTIARPATVQPAVDEVFDEEALETVRSLPGVNGPSLLPELIRLYLSDEPERLDRLAQLAAERRGEALGNEAHSFGGTAASFGGIQVRRVALELERTARAADWPGVVLQLGSLRDAAERLQAEVTRRHLAG